MITELAQPVFSWFDSDRSVPPDMNAETWVEWVKHAGAVGRHLTWRIAELLAYGQDAFGEAYYTLVEQTGFSPGYLQKLEGWGRRGLIETRRQVIAALPAAEGLPHAWWEAVAPLKDGQGRGWKDANANHNQIIHERQTMIENGLRMEMETPTFTAWVREYIGLVSQTNSTPVPVQPSEANNENDQPNPEGIFPLGQDDSLYYWQRQVGKWHRSVFGEYDPTDHVRAIAQKAKEEAIELQSYPCPEEAADLLIVALAACDRLEVDPVAILRDKLEVLKQRPNQLERDKERGIVQANELSG